VEDPTAAANIRWVLYVNLAWLVQLQQQQLSRVNASSSSSSRVQQQRVPPWHVQFLAAVGGPAWRAAWGPIANPPRQMFKQLEALHHKGQMLQMPAMRFGQPTAGGGQGSSSSSSSSAIGGDGDRGSALPSEAQHGHWPLRESAPVTQQRSFEGLLPARETLLLLLPEMILLQPMLATMMLCQPRMQDIWSSMMLRQPTAAKADAQQTADTMLQPLLQLLGPAVLQQLEAASSSGAGSGSGDGMYGSSDFAKYFSKLVQLIVSTGAALCSGGMRNFFVI
jgi:hypothetical protein